MKWERVDVRMQEPWLAAGICSDSKPRHPGRSKSAFLPGPYELSSRLLLLSEFTTIVGIQIITTLPNVPYRLTGWLDRPASMGWPLSMALQGGSSACSTGNRLALASGHQRSYYPFTCVGLRCLSVKEYRSPSCAIAALDHHHDQ